MKPFFAPNIDRRGRLVRATGSLLLLGGGVAACWKGITWLALILLASAAFVAFEAARGWCLARACGIKTNL